MDILTELSKSANISSVSDEGEGKVNQDTSDMLIDNTNNIQKEENLVSQEEQDNQIQVLTSDIVYSQENTSKQAFASEEVAEFNAFKERFPDKSIDDYKKLKTPISEIKEEDLLRQYYSEKEGMGEKEIAYAMKQIEVNDSEGSDFDDFSLDEDERLRREAKRERDLRLAREWREQYVTEHLSVSVQEGGVMTIEEYQKQVVDQQKQSRDTYLKSIYSVLPSIESIGLDVSGEQVSFIPDEDFKKEMKTTSENIEGLFVKFTNSDGTLKDPKGFITEVALWANPITREKMVKFRIEQAILRDRATQNKVRRNVGFEATNGISENSNSGDVEAFDKFFENRRRKGF